MDIIFELKKSKNKLFLYFFDENLETQVKNMTMS